MARDSHLMAGMPVDTTQERQALQQALFESASQLVENAHQFTRAWHRRWLDTTFEQQINALSTDLVGYLEGLREEFGRPVGPSPPQVSPLLGALLGTQDMPGPLTRLQMLMGNDPEALSLEAQRLLSEVDALFIQLNGLRAEWQEYLSLLSAPEPPTTRHPTQPFLTQDPLEGEPLPAEEVIELPPLPLKQSRRSLSSAVPAMPSLLEGDAHLRPTPALVTDNLKPPPPTSVGESVRQGMGGTLRVMLTLGVVLMLIVFLAYEAVSHLPLSDNQASRPPVAPTQMLATATTAPEATNTPLPTATTAPQPTATSPLASPTTFPASGSTQLSANPQVLLVPCPGNGAATLQLVDTGSQPLDWNAAPSTAGILLDGAANESGHLNPGEVALVSVTSQVQNAQGAITITAAGGFSPVTVPYTVSC
jgi:hypothetical protein